MSEVPDLRGAAEQNLSGRGGSEVYRVNRARRRRPRARRGVGRECLSSRGHARGCACVTVHRRAARRGARAHRHSRSLYAQNGGAHSSPGGRLATLASSPSAQSVSPSLPRARVVPSARSGLRSRGALHPIASRLRACPHACVQRRPVPRLRCPRHHRCRRRACLPADGDARPSGPLPVLTHRRRAPRSVATRMCRYNVPGCMVDASWNFNPEATSDDASCVPTGSGAYLPKTEYGDIDCLRPSCNVRYIGCAINGAQDYYLAQVRGRMWRCGAVAWRRGGMVARWWHSSGWHGRMAARWWHVSRWHGVGRQGGGVASGRALSLRRAVHAPVPARRAAAATRRVSRAMSRATLPV